MKTIAKTLSCFVLISSMFACTGPAGPAGPVGPDGAAGAAGPAGPTGAAGNANVTQYTYGAVTWPTSTSSLTYTIPVSSTILAKSELLCFVDQGNWYAIPGYTLGAASYIRNYYSPGSTSSTMTMARVGTGASETFNSVRILVIQANTVTPGRNAVDFTNYLEVKKYFNLPD